MFFPNEVIKSTFDFRQKRKRELCKGFGQDEQEGAWTPFGNGTLSSGHNTFCAGKHHTEAKPGLDDQTLSNKAITWASPAG
jgi:hypothetical protein